MLNKQVAIYFYVKLNLSAQWTWLFGKSGDGAEHTMWKLPTSYTLVSTTCGKMSQSCYYLRLIFEANMTCRHAVVHTLAIADF